MSESTAVEARSALDERQSDGGDDEHAKKRHLEAGGEKLAGIEGKQGESGSGKGIHHAAIAVKQARAQEYGAHQRGSPDGSADFSEQGVGNAEQNG